MGSAAKSATTAKQREKIRFMQVTGNRGQELKAWLSSQFASPSKQVMGQ